jgi:glutathione S-transferase
MTQTLLTLYYSPGACSLAAHIMLRELDWPFELKKIAVAEGENKQPEFLAINSRGRVPVLMVEGQPITELSAILTWLAQQRSDLFPPAGTLAAIRCSEWLAWLTSSLHISFAQIWRGERFSENPDDFAAIEAHGRAVLTTQFAEVEDKLTGRPFALGDSYSVVDPNLLVFYRWGNRIGIDMRQSYPVWTAHSERLLERPAVVAAVAAEGIEIWQSA